MWSKPNEAARSGVEVGGYQEPEAEAQDDQDSGNGHEFHVFMFDHVFSPLMGSGALAAFYGPTEGHRKQLLKVRQPYAAGGIGHDYPAVRAELGQHLAAQAAGGDGAGGVGDHGQGGQVAAAGGHGRKDRHALSADRGPQGGVLDIAAGEDFTGCGQDRGAHLEVGIGGIGRLPGAPGLVQELLLHCFIQHEEAFDGGPGLVGPVAVSEPDQGGHAGPPLQENCRLMAIS